jgi:hypothetical protein
VIGAGVLAGAVVVGAAGWWGLRGAQPAPDPRPITLPESLDGQPLADDPMADTNIRQIRADLPRWWPHRSAAFAMYDTDAVVRATESRGILGPHVLAVRGRFHGKGDVKVLDRVDAQAKTTHQTQDVGADHCGWNSTLVVCWRETDRLSVSVLNLGDSPDVARTAREVDQVWAAAAA